MAGKHLTERSYRDLATIVDARVMLSQFAGEKNQDFERLAHKWAQKVMALNSNASRDEILTASSDVLKPQDVVTNVKRMRDQLGLLPRTGPRAIKRSSGTSLLGARSTYKVITSNVSTAR